MSELAGWGWDWDWVGYLAALLTTVSFAPQAWLTWRTRDVRGISLGMYATFTVGIALWLAYGLLLGAWPLVLANSVTLLLALAILAMKLRYGRRRD
jgi:MtN3 and saliva related transmembrane protein